MVVFSMIQYPNTPAKDLLALAGEAGAVGIEWDDIVHLHAGHTQEQPALIGMLCGQI